MPLFCDFQGCAGWMLKCDCVSGVLESNSCCQSQRTCTQHRNHHSGLSQQTTAIMVRPEAWLWSKLRNQLWICEIMVLYFFMRLSVCSVYQGGGKRTAGKEEERLQSPGWFRGQDEWGRDDFCISEVNGFPIDLDLLFGSYALSLIFLSDGRRNWRKTGRRYLVEVKRKKKTRRGKRRR